jgi:hypothetical protein
MKHIKRDPNYLLKFGKMDIPLLEVKNYFESFDKPLNNKDDITLIKIDESLLIKKHINAAKRQRESYIQSKNNLKNGNILIVMDYKEKIKIGMSPRQISSEFYSQKQRSFLGFCVFYRDKNNILQSIYFDIISDCLKQTAYTVKCAFQLENFFILII